VADGEVGVLFVEHAVPTIDTAIATKNRRRARTLTMRG